MLETDLQHHLFLLTLSGKLHLAPIRNPQNVLDIGTGTGIWAMEFGAFPFSSLPTLARRQDLLAR
jgi:hypothetical protein